MSQAKELMDEIKFFDCEPAIYKVCLVASDHNTGYDAWVDFRSNIPGAPSSLSAHGVTPEEALGILLNTLMKSWGKCPHCGNYLHGKE